MEAGTKKVLLGVGLGCGGLVVVVFLTCGGLAWYGVHKAKTWAAPIAKAGKVVKVQRARLEQLDKQYPFTAPKKGPYVLTESRLKAYLAIREDGTSHFVTYQKKVDALEGLQNKLDQQRGKDSTSVGEVFGEAGKALHVTTEIVQTLAEVEKHFAADLEKNRMSPNEFVAISRAVYPREADAGAGPNAALLTEYQKQLEASRNPEFDAAVAQTFHPDHSLNGSTGHASEFHFKY